MVENYTWELYYVIDEGELLCLKCHAVRDLAEPENWIELTDENISALTFRDVRRAKHLIRCQDASAGQHRGVW